MLIITILTNCVEYMYRSPSPMFFITETALSVVGGFKGLTLDVEITDAHISNITNK